MVSLLPPSSTELERAYVQTGLALLSSNLADTLRNLDHVRPTSLQPWLAAEWGLSDFAKYFDNVQDLIAAGLPWLHLRGTAAAVKSALSWIDLSATLEEDGARLQIDPSIVIRPDQLADIIRLVNASIPAHVWFYRMYHGYDLRPLCLDRSRLDDALLDDDSGVWVSGVKLSFGTRFAAMLDADPAWPLPAGMLRQYSTRIYEDNSWRLDAWALDSEILLDAASGMISQLSAALADDPAALLPNTRTENHAALIDQDADMPLASMTSATRSTALADPVRGWTGTWSGNWCDPIPSRPTFESA